MKLVPFLILTYACSISVNPPKDGSQEKLIRKQLEEIENQIEIMEKTIYEIESYADALRKKPEDKAINLNELQTKMQILNTQHEILQKELLIWESNLQLNKE